MCSPESEQHPIPIAQANTMNNTKVVNLYKAKYTVYIGRPGKGKPNSIFGNPIALNRVCPECDAIHTAKGSTLKCYEKYLVRRLTQEPMFRAAVKALQGETLGCFCKPNPCHGDVLAKYAHKLNQQ
jgi:hypothetical protein